MSPAWCSGRPRRRFSECHARDHQRKSSRRAAPSFDSCQYGALERLKLCFCTLGEVIMIHDILVHVPTERVARPVVDASVSLTAGFGASRCSCDLLCIGQLRVCDGWRCGRNRRNRIRAAQRAAAALEIFEIEARTAGISYQSRASGELPGDAAASINCGLRSFCSRTRHKTLSTIPFLGKSCFSPVDRSCSCLISFAGPSKPSASVFVGTEAGWPPAH